jgi:uncharacterized protein YjbI with pentapeptide repeats
MIDLDLEEILEIGKEWKRIPNLETLVIDTYNIRNLDLSQFKKLKRLNMFYCEPNVLKLNHPELVELYLIDCRIINNPENLFHIKTIILEDVILDDFKTINFKTLAKIDLENVNLYNIGGEKLEIIKLVNVNLNDLKIYNEKVIELKLTNCTIHKLDFKSISINSVFLENLNMDVIWKFQQQPIVVEVMTITGTEFPISIFSENFEINELKIINGEIINLGYTTAQKLILKNTSLHNTYHSTTLRLLEVEYQDDHEGFPIKGYLPNLEELIIIQTGIELETKLELVIPNLKKLHLERITGEFQFNFNIDVIEVMHSDYVKFLGSYNLKELYIYNSWVEFDNDLIPIKRLEIINIEGDNAENHHYLVEKSRNSLEDLEINFFVTTMTGEEFPKIKRITYNNSGDYGEELILIDVNTLKYLELNECTFEFIELGNLEHLRCTRSDIDNIKVNSINTINLSNSYSETNVLIEGTVKNIILDNVKVNFEIKQKQFINMKFDKSRGVIDIDGDKITLKEEDKIVV